MYDLFVELLYASLGLTPLCLAYYYFYAWAQALVMTLVTAGLLSCINLEWGGLLGWWMRWGVVPGLAYLCYVLRKSPVKQPAPSPPRSRPATVSCTLPSHDLLATPQYQKIATQDRSEELLRVLSEFGIGGRVHGIQSGPAVTMYEFEPVAGLKISKIIVLGDDIARSMSAMSVRIAKVPGKNFIGIEVANPSQATVYLRDVVAAPEFRSATLPLGLGKDIAGRPVIEDLSKMPHLLVAGATGAGKSVAMHSMLLSLLYKLDPSGLRMLLIDPKMLEFSLYKDIPHLLHPVVTDPKEAVIALKWAVGEMIRRYKMMSECGVRDIVSYNSQFPSIPYIVVVVDEMADLMAVAGKEIELAVQRLAQMARAAGIHIIMATQRPSVDVITGTIKANFPSRISFRVSSQVDSRTIIGQNGAEQLLGRGDMLYMGAGGCLMRAHGPFVSEAEVQRVGDFLRSLGKPNYLEDLMVDVPEYEEEGSSGGGDERYVEAVELVRRTGKASTSFLVTNLGIGYNRASRLIQEMERRGVVSEARGAAHVRDVL